jgi:hypothetical protein
MDGMVAPLSVESSGCNDDQREDMAIIAVTTLKNHAGPGSAAKTANDRANFVLTDNMMSAGKSSGWFLAPIRLSTPLLAQLRVKSPYPLFHRFVHFRPMLVPFVFDPRQPELSLTRLV